MFRAQYVKTRILKHILKPTGSQCKEYKMGVMLARLWEPVNNLAAAFFIA